MRNSLLLIAVLVSSFIFGQCEDERYKTQIFDNFSISTDIIYGQNYTQVGELQELHLDLYEPADDLEEERAVIVLAHGGFFIEGSKDGPDVVQFAQDFAKMGYVVASIQYRLGMEADPFFPSEQTATEAVIRGFHDGKAAVRFLRKTIAEDGNPYRLSNDLIFSAGVSAGGFITVHNLYLNELDELPAIVDTTKLGLGGGVEGQSGNLNYSSEFVAGVNIAGAIGDTAWIDEGEAPLISFHGDDDGTVPYNIGTIGLFGLELGTAMGSFPIHEKLNSFNIENCLETQEGEGHVPHVTNNLEYDTLMVMARNFLARYICNTDLTCTYEEISVGINEQKISLKVYPNPSSDFMRIELPKSQWLAEIYDLNGRVVFRKENFGNNSMLLRKDDVGKGMFTIRLTSDIGVINEKLIFN
ncbi:MAG: T9SS type A sorting domain-containing protein [Bacteroidota bacterium]